MTWVTGTSKWGTLAYDLTRVITGEVADGQGVTVAAADRWVRERSRTVTDAVLNSTTTMTSAAAGFTSDDITSIVTAPGVPAGTTITAVPNATTVTLSAAATTTASGVTAQIHTDTIRSPASRDVPSGDMSNRCGYFTSQGNTVNSTTNLATPATATARILTPFNGTQPVGWARWSLRLFVQSGNTVPGNYSTAMFFAYIVNLDSGAMVSSMSDPANAAGVFTFPYGLTVMVADPSGLLPTGTQFTRAFTTTYLYGVDWWPMWCRTAGPATFTTPPPGTQGTDWDIADITSAWGGTADTMLCTRGNLVQGLGIKTATGLGSGNRYTVSFPMALGKCRIYNTATAGVLGLDVGGARKDAATASVANNGGMRVTTWAKPFSVAGSTTANSAVEYFMSVTADGFVVVLNGDPASGGGKLATAYYCAYTPADTRYDRFPMVFNMAVLDYSVDLNSNAYYTAATQFPYWSQRRRQDGSAEAVRDWQTGWMRGEPYYWGAGTVNLSGSIQTDIPNNIGSGPTTYPGYLQAVAMDSNGMNGPYGLAPMTQAKPSLDGKWWLYPAALGESGWGQGASANSDENRVLRGWLDRWVYVPDGGWSSADQLSDTVTGSKWLLIKPDLAGHGTTRIRTGPSIYSGGPAIREI